MLCNINQRSKQLNLQIQSVGCLFLCMAYVSPLTFSGTEGCTALNYIWDKAKKLGFIDENGTIMSHNDMLDLFCISAKYDDKHHMAGESIPEGVISFGQFVYHIGHFVVINRTKTVIFDPLITSSAVKLGELKTMRWYYAV